MQVGRTRLTPEERQRRFNQQLCLYCGQPGPYLHLSGPAKRPGSPVIRGTLASQTTSGPNPTTRIILPASLQWSRELLHLHMFVDSGADDSFIDSSIVEKSQIPLEILYAPKTVNALDGRHLATVTHCTTPLSLIISGNHWQHLQLYVISSPSSPVVLGLPWLRLHNPRIDWCSSAISSWSAFCHSLCLRSAATTVKPPPPPRVTPPSPDLSLMPQFYYNLATVFSKE